METNTTCYCHQTPDYETNEYYFPYSITQNLHLPSELYSCTCPPTVLIGPLNIITAFLSQIKKSTIKHQSNEENKVCILPDVYLKCKWESILNLLVCNYHRTFHPSFSQHPINIPVTITITVRKG